MVSGVLFVGYSAVLFFMAFMVYIFVGVFFGLFLVWGPLFFGLRGSDLVVCFFL